MQVVKNAFRQLLSDSEFALPTPRVERAKDCIRYLQTKEGDAGVAEFADTLWCKLTSIAEFSFRKLTYKSHSKQREHLWSSFHQFRANELIAIWEELLVKVQMPEEYRADPWTPQVIARLVMEAVVKATCSVELEKYDEKPLDADEHNALRYAAGYVLRSVKMRSKKNSSGCMD